jgi:3-phenylpropionate/trans-cinnamate dioxygenase ferredoxin subunit
MAEFIKVANVEDISPGSVKVVNVEDVQVVLCNVGNKFYAVADLCSHDNGPLGEGELIDAEIECPRHGARFDLVTGNPTCLPAVIPIPVYEVEVRGQEIWINSTPKSKSS